MAFEQGPYIQAACFCEMVIEDKFGVISIMRIIDTITHNVQGESPPEELPAFIYRTKLVLMLKPGTARGRFTIQVVPELPNGSTKKPIFATIHMDGEERGANLIVDVNFTYEFEGLYWFHVNFEDDKLTSIPVRVRYNRLITSS